jgi:hypothetical protein
LGCGPETEIETTDLIIVRDQCCLKDKIKTIDKQMGTQLAVPWFSVALEL